MIKVDLTPTEMRMAIAAATDRRLRALQNGYQDKHGFSGKDPWDVDINGAAAEMAYSKARKRYFEATLDSFKEADHGGNVQIRWTGHRNGKLIIREGDNPEHYYVLVVSPAPKMQLIGWAEGVKCMTDRYKTNLGVNNRPPVWAVPQSDLGGF